MHRRPSLASRTALATVAVAVVAVLITGVVALQLIPHAAERQARQSLAAQADLVVTAYERLDQPGAVRLARLRQLLAAQDITLTVIGPRGGARGSPADERDIAAVTTGSAVSAIRETGAGTIFVEGRPADAGGGVLLTQPADVVRNPAQGAVRSLLRAMLLGLVVAVVVGLLLALWLSRPLRQAADAARRMSLGQRDVTVQPAGPQEVADVAEALGGLSTALATSEARQREFLLSVSHELRTPLTAIRGYAEALADGVVAPEETAHIGTTITSEAARLDRLVTDLLDLARLQADEFRIDSSDVDLRQVVSSAADVWASRARTVGVGLRLDVPPTPVMIRTDPVRVRQIIDGLAENALRVTPQGQPIVFGLRTEDSAAVLEVRDGGPGLTEDDLKVAFERSALYDRYRGVRRVGTGLGLALVAGLAHRLGGQAAAAHAPEGGAAFSVRLPLQSSNIQRTNV
jgi:two-component system, OmpR family, sensor kinase